MTSRRRALTVAGIAVAATLAIGGAALAAGSDDAPSGTTDGRGHRFPVAGRLAVAGRHGLADRLADDR
jgi:hypothetical protein